MEPLVITTLAIAAASFMCLFWSAVAAVISYIRKNKRLKEDVKRHKETLKEANNALICKYLIKPIYYDGILPNRHGYSVVRVTNWWDNSGYVSVETTVKIFLDEDNEFNKREAQNLCDILTND